MLLKTAQVFLSTSFLCPNAVETQSGGRIINSFTTLELTPELYNREKMEEKLNEYNRQNYFIHKLGQIKMFASDDISPFLVDYCNPATPIPPNNQVLLSVCYGVRSTFSAFCRFSGYENISCIVQPFVHFFPNRTVTIIYSCYLEDKKPTDKADILYAIKKLKQAYQCDQREIEIKTSKALTISGKPISVHSFRDITEFIKERIRNSIPEYDFLPNCPFLTHSLVRFIQGTDGENFSLSDFERICTTILLTNRFRSDKIEKTDTRDYWNRRRFNYFYISEHDSINIDHGCFIPLQPQIIKKSRYRGWRFFAEIELALQEKLLFGYMKNKAEAISQYILEASRLQNKGSFKINIYDQNYEKMISRFFNSDLTTNVNSHTRMIVYRVYGSKDSRKDYVAAVQSVVKKALDDSNGYESIYEKISGPFSSIVSLFHIG